MESRTSLGLCLSCDKPLEVAKGCGSCMYCGRRYCSADLVGVNWSGKPLGVWRRVAIRGPGPVLWSISIASLAFILWTTMLPHDLPVYLVPWTIVLFLGVFQLRNAYIAAMQLAWERATVVRMAWRYARFIVVVMAMVAVVRFRLSMSAAIYLSRPSFEVAAREARAQSLSPNGERRRLGLFSIVEIRTIGATVWFKTSMTTITGEPVWFVHEPPGHHYLSQWLATGEAEPLGKGLFICRCNIPVSKSLGSSISHTSPIRVLYGAAEKLTATRRSASSARLMDLAPNDPDFRRLLAMLDSLCIVEQRAFRVGHDAAAFNPLPNRLIIVQSEGGADISIMLNKAGFVAILEEPRARRSDWRIIESDAAQSTLQDIFQMAWSSEF